MKKYLIILLLLIIYKLSYTQTTVQFPDSVSAIVTLNNIDTAQINTLYNYAIVYLTTEPQIALSLADKIHELSLKINYQHGLAKSAFVSGMFYFNHAYYSKATEKYLLAIQKFEELNDNLGQAQVYARLGQLSDILTDYEKAIRYKNKALQIYEQQNNPRSIALMYNSLGITYKYLNQNDKALEFWQHASEIYLSINDTAGYSKTINNIGFLKESLGEYQQALQLYTNSLNIDKSQNDIFGQTISYNNLGSIFSRLHDYPKATAFLDSALQLADITGNKYLRKENFHLRMRLDSLRGTFLDALFWQQQTHFLQDSIFAIEKDKTISELNLFYELLEKKQENEILLIQQKSDKSTIEQQKKLNFFIILALFILLGFIVIILNQQMKMKKANTLLKEQLHKNEIQKEEIQVQTENLQQINKLLEEKNERIKQQNSELENHRNHLEELVLQRTAEIEKEKIRAEQSDKLKTAFLANMSHEVRTPMNSIIGFASLLEYGVQNQQKQKIFIKNIKQNTECLLQIINNLTDIARIESGTISIYKSECNLNTLLQEVIEEKTTFSTKFEDNKLELKVSFPSETEDFVFETDLIRLKQIIAALFDNALKFTDIGFVKVGFFINEKLHIFVEDTGIGISENNMEVIFEKFTKLEVKSEKIYSGVGIGLPIARRLAELIDGKINVVSKKGKGSVFTLTMNYEKYSWKPNIKKIPIAEKISFTLPENIQLNIDGNVENYQQLMLLLTKKISAQWERIQQKQSLSEIKNFAEHLKKTGETYNCSYLEEYGLSLYQSVTILDFEKMKNILEKYPLIVEQLQQYFNNKNMKIL